METLTISFDNKEPLNRREEKAAKEAELALNGLNFSEVHRVLARVISTVNNAIYLATCATKPELPKA